MKMFMRKTNKYKPATKVNFISTKVYVFIWKHRWEFFDEALPKYIGQVINGINGTKLAIRLTCGVTRRQNRYGFAPWLRVTRRVEFCNYSNASQSSKFNDVFDCRLSVNMKIRIICTLRVIKIIKWK